jgi:citrate synthase
MAGKSSRGLADVVAASTARRDVDGHAGRLSYRGYDIGEGKRSWIPLDAR